MHSIPSLSLTREAIMSGVLFTIGLAGADMSGQEMPRGDAARGKTFFQVSCAVCHSPVLGPDNTVITKQGPSLVGVVGRKAGSLPNFNYTKAIRESGFTWDPATLYRFLANPMVVTARHDDADSGGGCDAIARMLSRIWRR